MSNHFYPWALDRDQTHLLPDPIVIEDDQKEPIEISPDHVVTKDMDGNPRSRFEDDKWDFRGQVEGGWSITSRAFPIYRSEMRLKSLAFTCGPLVKTVFLLYEVKLNR